LARCEDRKNAANSHCGSIENYSLTTLPIELAWFQHD